MSMDSGGTMEFAITSDNWKEVADGNYRVVCEALVDGKIVANDFLIFNVNERPEVKTSVDK